MKDIVIDFETSDLYRNGGKPIEFAAIILDEAREVMGEFYTRMRLEDGEEISPEAFAQHGITRELLENEPTRVQALRKFVAFLQDNHINSTTPFQLRFIGQNLAFDLAFFWDWWGDKYLEIFHQIALTL